MKKFFPVLFFLLLFVPFVYADDNSASISSDMQIQNRVSDIGFRILNANKANKHIIFSYSSKDTILKNDSSVLTRNILISDVDLKYIETDDELAAYLAREVSFAMKSFDGAFGGFVDSMQVKMSPKKYEIVADKRAVDYLVKAGYNPLGLITYINKSCPQARQDVISKRNLTSKRLMNIYEKIYFDYPYYLANNSYLENPYYQNFLLTSIDNRKKFKESLKEEARGKVKYD